MKKVCYIVAYERQFVDSDGRKVDRVFFVMKSLMGIIKEDYFDFELFIEFVRDMYKADTIYGKTVFIDLTESGLYDDVLMYKKTKKIGRPSLGKTKKVSITLEESTWEFIDDLNMSRSEVFRNAIEQYIRLIKGGELDT